MVKDNEHCRRRSAASVSAKAARFIKVEERRNIKGINLSQDELTLLEIETVGVKAERVQAELETMGLSINNQPLVVKSLTPDEQVNRQTSV